MPSYREEISPSQMTKKQLKKGYNSPNAANYTKQHKTLAIIPPNVIVDPAKSKIKTAEDKKIMEKTISQNIQNGIQERLLNASISDDCTS